MAVWVRMILSVLVVYLCDYMADWEPWFPAAAQCQESVSSYSQAGKRPSSKFEVWFLLNVYCFCTILK